MNLKPAIAAVLLLGGITSLRAQPAEKNSSMANCPMMKDAAMEERGDHAMGFSHAKTTHHFRLGSDGGAIEVSANNPRDAASIEEIRGHLGHIAKLFAKGNFQIPMLVHGRSPDGAAAMAKQKSNIHYDYEQMSSGGRVRIRTNNREALKAVHDFLRFQITEHQTGDRMTAVKASSSPSLAR